MRILALETSSARLSIAAGTETAILKEHQGPLAWRHAESLFEGMQTVLKQVRWPVQSLTGIAVSTGPGSFTGIRIGLAAARALSQSLKVPLTGIPSLQILAFDHLSPGRLVCPVIDALRGDVFTGIYQLNPKGKLQVLLKECRLPIPDLLRRLKPRVRQPLLFVGDAASTYAETLLPPGKGRWEMASPEGNYPRASSLIRLGRELLRKGRGAYQQVVPLYLRSAAAVERRAR